MDFRFSPRPNLAHKIAWRPWSVAAFREAEEQDKPVFLSLSAVWCHWCHVMDESTFSDEEVIAGLNEHFIPIRVDNDRRPDINSRYNMGGWPTVAFLTSDGEIMTGSTYVPPRQFRDLLESIRDLWRMKSADIREEVAAARERAGRRPEEERPAGELDESLATRALAPALAAYDRSFGGFGDAAKFPRTDILGAFLARLETEAGRTGTPGGAVRDMLEQTLDAMRAGELWDPVEGGFFRYTTRRDWSAPHFEKMLEENARLIQIYARSASLLERPDFLETAQQARHYLDRTLWQSAAGGYGGSQDADEDYYALASAEERAGLPTPYVDIMVYTDWNAEAVQALATLYTAELVRGQADPQALERAATIMENLLARETERGLLVHDSAEDSPDSFLGDQLAVLGALLALYEASGDRRWRAEARRRWECIDLHFTESPGPLLADLARDPSPGPEREAAEPRMGPLARSDAPPSENARLAAALARLALIERDSGLAARSRQILERLAPRIDELRDFAAETARAVLLVLREPLHVTVVGPEERAATKALLEQAHRLPRTHRVVDLLDPDRDADILERAGLGAAADVRAVAGAGAPEAAESGTSGAAAQNGARAYVCRGTTCAAPVTTPEDLERVAGATEAAG